MKCLKYWFNHKDKSMFTWNGHLKSMFGNDAFIFEVGCLKNKFASESCNNLQISIFGIWIIWR